MIKEFYQINEDRKIIKWMITRNCNLSCWYCNEHKKEEYISEIDLEKILNFIQYINTNHNFNDIILYGGEPTIHKNFNYIIEKLSNFNIHIMTNLEKPIDFWKSLSDNISIVTSFHYTNDNKLNDFKEKIKLFKNIRITLMLDENQEKEIQGLYNYIKEYNSDISVKIRTVNNKPHPMTSQANKEYMADSELYTWHEITEKGWNKFKNYKCNAGKTYMFIDPQGNYYPCTDYMHINNPILNLCKIDDFSIIKLVETLCKRNDCSCDYFLKKEKVFKWL